MFWQRIETSPLASLCGAVADVTLQLLTPGALVKLAAADFAPAGDVACTEIYGGPGKATITGALVDGATVNGTFTRSNGCEIGRWDRMVELGLIPTGLGSL